MSSRLSIVFPPRTSLHDLDEPIDLVTKCRPREHDCSASRADLDGSGMAGALTDLRSHPFDDGDGSFLRC
jgi:hypothetical protein